MKLLAIIFLGIPLALLLVYLIARLCTSAYFRSKREHWAQVRDKFIKELRDE